MTEYPGGGAAPSLPTMDRGGSGSPFPSVSCSALRAVGALFVSRKRGGRNRSKGAEERARRKLDPKEKSHARGLHLERSGMAYASVGAGGVCWRQRDPKPPRLSALRPVFGDCLRSAGKCPQEEGDCPTEGGYGLTNEVDSVSETSVQAARSPQAVFDRLARVGRRSRATATRRILVGAEPWMFRPAT